VSAEPVIAEPTEPVAVGEKEPVPMEPEQQTTVVEIIETAPSAAGAENGATSYVVEPDEQPCSSNGAVAATNLQNGAGGGDEEENCAISTAWEILDLARIIFER